MKKLLLVALPILLVLIAMPFTLTLMSLITTTAATECRNPSQLTGRDATIGTPAAEAASASDHGSEVLAELTRLQFADGYPRLSHEQARNALVIAEVAQEVKAPRYGLQIAVATAIQESHLVNLSGGDRDSAGLFQQRPSQGWGSHAQITTPTLAARAFFGRAAHTTNPGLLDIPGWFTMPLTRAAQAVQRSGYPDAYAQWEEIASDITDLLGGDLPSSPEQPADETPTASSSVDCQDDTVAPITMGTLNILGARHTAPPTTGAMSRYDTWDQRLPGAVKAIEQAGLTIAALQEVHPPQVAALRDRYATRWDMYPTSLRAQNKVIWERRSWEMTDARLIPIRSFGGRVVQTPLVQLTGAADSPYTGQVIWIWSIHNPANAYGNGAPHRTQALHRQLSKLTDLATSGLPVVIMGDFNDGRDGPHASQCVLTPTMSNAFGGSADPCRKPKRGAFLDHLYGTNLTWADAYVDRSTQDLEVADHPLVVATTAASRTGCATAASSDYDLGDVQPQLTQLVNVLAPQFSITSVGGYRPSAADPQGHPAGLAADFMTAAKAQGDRLANYARAHARELGIDYIIWWQRIWSLSRAAEGWRPMEDRGSDTQNHRDHVHINVQPDTTPQAAPGRTTCADVVYPVPAKYLGTDNRNWHAAGAAWSTWHTGTDFSAPCGTPVYAAHAGTVEIDTTQPWSGRYLVKVSTGATALTTWYAHMEKVTVSRAETVQPGQQIGLVGEEGNATGCHLHFEVHLKNGAIYGTDNVDPTVWLAAHATRPPKSG